LTYQPLEESELNYEDAEIDLTANATPINWVSKGAVNAIKDQKQCGSCWAFSAVSAMESAHKIKSGKLLSFAEQQLVDCSSAGSCNGGNVGAAFKYYEGKGAMAESKYTYTARNGTCKYSSSNTGVKSTGHKSVTSNDPSAMKSALAGRPLSVGVAADSSAFGNYKSGIFNSSSCGTSLDHATVVVGWGSSGGTDYWIMRNSWGTSWGEKGYMRLAIVSGAGICGIQKDASYPTTN